VEKQVKLEHSIGFRKKSGNSSSDVGYFLNFLNYLFMDLATLKEEHKKIKEALNSKPSEVTELLKEHFEREEEFFERYKERLGGDDELSPLGMVRSEHKLILDKLEREGLTEEVRDLIQYHLTKEETQIFTLIE
jgi:DUF438 domain-containing protein